MKAGALRRIRFGYSSKKLLQGCIDIALKASIGSEVAAIFCSMSIPQDCPELGCLLAALANFCNVDDGRAVVVIDLRDDNDDEVMIVDYKL